MYQRCDGNSWQAQTKSGYIWDILKTSATLETLWRAAQALHLHGNLHRVCFALKRERMHGRSPPGMHDTVTRGAWHCSRSILAQMAQLNLLGGQDAPAPPAAAVSCPPSSPPPGGPGPDHQHSPPPSGVPSLTCLLSLNRAMRISPLFAQSFCLPPSPAIKILLPCLPPSSPSRRLPLLSLELPCSCRAGQTIGCFREIHFWANLPCISVSLTL